MTNQEMEKYAVRMNKAINRIGGAAGLLRLPEGVREVLKNTNDLVVKTQMMESIADAISVK